MLALAGMTPQKLEDMKASFDAKEKRKKERQAASKRQKVKDVVAPDEIKKTPSPKDEAKASTGDPEKQDEAGQESALDEAVTADEIEE